MTNPTDIPAFQSGFGEIDQPNTVIGQNAVTEDPNLVGNLETQRGEVMLLEGLVRQLDGLPLPPDVELMKNSLRSDVQAASMDLQSNKLLGAGLITRIANEVNSASQAVQNQGAKETQAALNDILSSMVVSTALLQGHETGSAKEAAATFSLSAKASDPYQVGEKQESTKDKFQHSIIASLSDEFLRAAGGIVPGSMLAAATPLLTSNVKTDGLHYVGAFADAHPGNIPGLGAGRSVEVQK